MVGAKNALRSCDIWEAYVCRTAELLNSFPEPDDASDTDVDSPMSDAPHSPLSPSQDTAEVRLEARESHKYLLAKTYFDCREFDRCAAVFLPSALPKPPPPATTSPAKPAHGSKSKAKSVASRKPSGLLDSVRGVSQRSLFLALYAKYMAGEKRMNEESEMILGPQDGGVTMNKELPAISAILEEWFHELPSSGRQSQGWLEYLYGIVLAKGKNEKQAIDYLVQSVKLYEYNWGAWQELAGLLGTKEEVRTSYTHHSTLDTAAC